MYFQGQFPEKQKKPTAFLLQNSIAAKSKTPLLREGNL